MRRRAVPLLILVLTFVAGFGLIQRGQLSRAEADSQPLTSSQQAATGSSQPTTTYSIFAGLWRVDGGF